MSKLSRFFKEPYTAVGVFYPLHCMVAVFDRMEVAQDAQQKLEAAGVRADDVIVVTGEEFIALEHEQSGAIHRFMRELSRVGGMEQISTDHNLDFASRGAAFLIVRCTSEARKNRAWAAMQGLSPLAAHYYDRLGVDHLAGGFSTT